MVALHPNVECEDLGAHGGHLQPRRARCACRRHGLAILTSSALVRGTRRSARMAHIFDIHAERLAEFWETPLEGPGSPTGWGERAIMDVTYLRDGMGRPHSTSVWRSVVPHVIV